jgi:hypothetical protein
MSKKSTRAFLGKAITLHRKIQWLLVFKQCFYYIHQQKFFQSTDKALKTPFYKSIELIVLTQRKTKCFAITGNTMIVFPSTSLNYNCFGQIRKKNWANNIFGQKTFESFGLTFQYLNDLVNFVDNRVYHCSLNTLKAKNYLI